MEFNIIDKAQLALQCYDKAALVEDQIAGIIKINFKTGDFGEEWAGESPVNKAQILMQLCDKQLITREILVKKIFKIGEVKMGACCCNDGESGGNSLDIILDVGKNTDRVKIMREQISAIATCVDKMSQSINKVREVVDLEVKKLDEKAVIPAYAHKGDAGFDLSAIVLEKTSDSYTDKTTILPGQKYIARTGLAFAVPQGYELQVRPRSGLAYKHGITVINSPGTVDSGYRGEVMVILLNTGTEPFEIKTGDRIAQAVINKLPKVIIREVEDLDKTERGSGGFGSTGK